MYGFSSRSEPGPVTRSRARSRARNMSRNRNASRNRNRSGNRRVTRSRSRNGPVTRAMSTTRNAVMKATRRFTRDRRPSIKEQMVPTFNPIPRQSEAEEGYNSNQSAKTEPYSEHNDNFTNFNNALVPVRANSVRLENQPLERRLSAGERQRLAQSSGSDLILAGPENSPLLERFYSVAGAENSPPNSQSLQRFVSVSEYQSPLRFVLYTSDLEIAQRFTQDHPIHIQYNSNQYAPLTSVYLNKVSHDERKQIRGRLPESVQYLSDSFTEGQFNNSITLDHYFLLTIEQDTVKPERPDQLAELPTGEIYGVLCCSEETATRNSASFLDSAGSRLIPFDTFIGTPYIYVHLFTFLSNRTVGNQFFTGSFMLEGLYKLFNPTEQNERIIYLEAITIPATLQFYDRFGMLRLMQMEINGILYYFDPFKGFVVPDEIPYVLYQESQIRDAAIAAEETRRTRQTQVAQRVQASIPGGLPVVTNESRRRLENNVLNFSLRSQRRDPRGRR